MIMSIEESVDDDKEEKTTKACKTSNPVAIVCFTPATTEKDVRIRSIHIDID
jgi:hypothetical protein